MSIQNIPKTELIERASKELQKVEAIKPPQWSLFAKTGTFKQRQPSRDDWWFVRAAALLRRLSAAKGPIGVQKLRTLYGGRKNMGAAPERFYRGSGNIIRKAFQQLEKAGLAKRIDKGTRKGRVITPQGMSFLGKIADAYMKEHNIVLPKKSEIKLSITEPQKEKPKRVRAPRKKKVEAPEAPKTEAPAESRPADESKAKPTLPAEAAAGAPAAEKPKRKRAPRKKKEAAPEAPKAEPTPAPEPKEEKPAEAPKTEEPKAEPTPAPEPTAPAEKPAEQPKQE